MKLKVLLPALCCLFYFNHAMAQRQNVYYFKNSGKKVSTADSADFTRVVSEPDAGSTLYNVREIYKNGKPKLLGKTSTVETLTLEGECVTYYPDGHKKEYGSYVKNRLFGDVYNYYPNGRLYTYIKYKEPDLPFIQPLIMACADSTGKQLAVDGNGHYIRYDTDFKNIVEEGELKAGLRDGIWKSSGTNKNEPITFNEIYANGKFISGEYVDHNGKAVKYDIKEKAPQFKGGPKAFNMFLGQTVRYPENARRNFIQGMVVVTFVVEKDGSLSDVKAVRSPNEELSAEAIKAVKQSPPWEPGIQNGLPVRVSYTVPVNFALGSPRQ